MRTHLDGLGPIRTDTTGQRIQLAGQGLELLQALATGIDFKQLDVNGRTPRIFLERLDQNLLGLRVTAIGHVNIGFSHRINIIGIDRAGAGLAELIGHRRGVAGVNALPACIAEDRIGPKRVRIRHGSRCRRRRLTATTDHGIGTQQRGDARPAQQEGRILQHAVEQPRLFFRLGFDRRLRQHWFGRLCHLGGFRLGRLHRLLRLRRCRLGRFGRRRFRGRRLSRLPRDDRLFFRFDFRLRFRLHFVFLLRLKISQLLILHGQQILQIPHILFEQGNTLLRFFQGALCGDLVFRGGGGFRSILLRILGLGNLDLVTHGIRRLGLFLSLCRDLSGVLLGRRGFTRCGIPRSLRQFLAIGVPVVGLRPENLACLIGRNGFNLSPVRQPQNRPGFQAIQILTEKSGFIVPVEGNQHLLQRDTIVLMRRCNFTERIPGLDLDIACLPPFGKRWLFLDSRLGFRRSILVSH